MKKINKTTLMLFALVLSLSVTVGATLAYFSDYEQASGGATLNLGGKTELTEGSNENEKDIVIKNVYAEVPYDKPDAGYNYEGPVEDLPRNVCASGIQGIPGIRIQNVRLENIELV